MNNDLISRSALLEEMKSIRFDGIRDTDEWYDLWMSIRTAPVAYDVDKVMRRLKGRLSSREKEDDDWDIAFENESFRQALKDVETGFCEVGVKN